jgi:TRAP-type C4-dicarboxylate transport system permease small subunit
MLTTQELPAMRISMTWLYASLPAGALLVILYEIHDLVGFLRRQRDRVTGGI